MANHEAKDAYTALVEAGATEEDAADAVEQLTGVNPRELVSASVEFTVTFQVTVDEDDLNGLTSLDDELIVDAAWDKVDIDGIDGLVPIYDTGYVFDTDDAL